MPAHAQHQQAVLAAAEAAAHAAVHGSGGSVAAGAARLALTQGFSSVGAGFDKLGGIDDHAAALRELVLLPLQAPQLFDAYNIRAPRGVLLHGPPGSGKTLLAYASAIEADAALFVINAPELVSEFLGESEVRLRVRVGGN